MTEQAAQIQADALAAIDGARNEAALEEARVKFLGKKSPLNALAAEMRNLPNEDKPKLGAALNMARQAISNALETSKQKLQDAADATSVEGLDVTMASHSKMDRRSKLNSTASTPSILHLTTPPETTPTPFILIQANSSAPTLPRCKSAPWKSRLRLSK